MKFLRRSKEPVEYDWTGTDVLVEICPGCGGYREVKFAFGSPEPPICTDCHNARTTTPEAST